MEALPIHLILIDLHNPSIIHLATVVVPPVFAIAEAEHKSGKDMLASVVAGYEVGGRVGESVIPESYFLLAYYRYSRYLRRCRSANEGLGLDGTRHCNVLAVLVHRRQGCGNF